MARNQIEKYVNELNIRKAGYIQKQQNEYKFARLKKSLDVLKRASYFQTIPDELIEEVKMIFKLMPIHELYYVTINEEEFKEYIERLNRFSIKVLDDYESYIEIISPDSWKVTSVIFYILILFNESIEKRFGDYAIPVVLGCLIIFWIYENRWRFREISF